MENENAKPSLFWLLSGLIVGIPNVSEAFSRSSSRPLASLLIGFFCIAISANELQKTWRHGK